MKQNKITNNERKGIIILNNNALKKNDNKSGKVDRLAPCSDAYVEYGHNKGICNK